MALTDMAVKSAVASGNPCKLFDGGGLFLFVSGKGGRLLRLEYRFAGKEKLLSIGAYPAVSLKEAREGCPPACPSAAGLSRVAARSALDAVM